MEFVIQNANIVNHDTLTPQIQDILVVDGKIKEVASSIDVTGKECIDLKGKTIIPGLVDLHVHLREPGREDKETIETGSKAAVKGGFTSICCMPNTTPTIDTAQDVQFILDQAKKVGLVHIYPVGAMTKDRKGQAITEMMDLKRAGCVGVSDDGCSVMNAGLMRRVFEYAKMADLLVMQHCEDEHLSNKGVMNEGELSILLGLKGDPIIAETVIIARDIELARYLNTRIHFMHVSSARSVELIRRAKEEGIQISCEVTPHHFALSEEVVQSFDTSTKVNPPLRTALDIAAIKQGLKDGIIDCIVTDHAPHTHEDKEVEFDAAPPGLIGLETAFALGLKELVGTQVLSLAQLVEKMSFRPSQIIGLHQKGKIEVGKDADFAVVDLDKPWTLTKEDIVSKSKNTPFIGWSFQGRIVMTICAGKIVYQE